MSRDRLSPWLAIPATVVLGWVLFVGAPVLAPLTAQDDGQGHSVERVGNAGRPPEGDVHASLGSTLTESEPTSSPRVEALHASTPAGPLASHFMSRTVSRTVSPLPSVTQELSSDGLPVSALHCSFDGGLMSCGSCRTDGDCPRGMGCIPNRLTRRFECMASECEEDAHCFPGFVCRTLNVVATGNTLIRRCAPTGLRGEGEPCDPEPLSPAGSCREDLRCVDGTCGMPCRGGEPSSCPAGHVCREGREGFACIPDCTRLGCPEGQQCKRVGDAHQCLAHVRGDCPETPCPEGERCNAMLSRERGSFWCARLCNPLVSKSCPVGQVCGQASGTASTCYRSCDPRTLDSCGEGWRCTTVTEDLSLWGCRPILD